MSRELSHRLRAASSTILLSLMAVALPDIAAAGQESSTTERLKLTLELSQSLEARAQSASPPWANRLFADAGLLYDIAGDTVLASKAFGRAQTARVVDPTTPRIDSFVWEATSAEIVERLGQSRRSSEALTVAERISYKNYLARALGHAAVAFYDDGNRARSLELLKRAKAAAQEFSRSPGWEAVDAYAWVAEAHAQTGDIDEALRSALALNLIDYDWSRTYLRILGILLQGGRETEALHAIARIAGAGGTGYEKEANRDYAELLRLRLARWYAARGRRSEAVRLIAEVDRALTQRKSSGAAAAAFFAGHARAKEIVATAELAISYDRLGERRRAAELFKECMESFENLIQKSSSAKDVLAPKLAAALAQGGRLPQAAALLNDRSVASRVEPALAAAAITLADEQRYVEAFSTANAIPDRNKRGRALVEITARYWRASQAVVTVNKELRRSIATLRKE